MHAIRHPRQNLALERFGAMHAGIVQHDHSEGIGVFLSHKLIKRLDDGLRGDRLGGRVVDQLPFSAHEPQHVQSIAF